TANYGEAGAIDRYGPTDGLPGAYSGHNSYWWWGPPIASPTGVTIAVGYDRIGLTQLFRRVTLAATIRNAQGVANDEEGQSVWICHGLRAPWAAVWPELKSYG